MKNIISFNLWGDNPKYTIGAIKNAEIAATIYPGWICYFYVGDTVPDEIKQKLQTFDHVKLIHKSEESNNFLNYFWHLSPASDPDVCATIFRNTHCSLNHKEKVAVDEWLKSDKNAHIIQPDSSSRRLREDGMWGIKYGVIPHIPYLIENFNRIVESNKGKNITQKFFFSRMINPLIFHTAMIHDNNFKTFPISTL